MRRVVVCSCRSRTRFHLVNLQGVLRLSFIFWFEALTILRKRKAINYNDDDDFKPAAEGVVSQIDARCGWATD